ncbi:MAG: hypothetical protein M1840_003251 [Geoglossum simile]|nr:MAG: hypothetical protein M1840_003251 [Geoglossum simile]
MDPFSLSVGVAGLVSLTVQLSRIVSNYIAGVKSAAVELSTMLTVLNSTLSRLSTFLCEENANGSSFAYTSVLFSTTGACKAKLQLLNDKLDTADGRRIGRAINQLKWPLDEKRTRMAVQDLQAYIQTFGFALTVDGALLSKTSSEVSDTLKYQLETIPARDDPTD